MAFPQLPQATQMSPVPQAMQQPSLASQAVGGIPGGGGGGAPNPAHIMAMLQMMGGGGGGQPQQAPPTPQMPQGQMPLPTPGVIPPPVGIPGQATPQAPQIQQPQDMRSIGEIIFGQRGI